VVSEWSVDKCGISERMTQLRIALAHVRSRDETFKGRPLACVRQFWNANLESLLPGGLEAIEVNSYEATDVVTFTTLNLGQDQV